MKKSDKNLLLIVLILAGVWYFGMGGQQQLSAAGQMQAAVQSGAACEGLATQPIVYATADWIDPTQNNKETQVATTVIFAKPGSPVVYNVTTSSATTQSTTAVPCGMPLAVVAGDGGGTTYYYNGVSTPAVDRISIDATGILVKKSGAASLYVHNATSTGWATTTNLVNTSMTDPDTVIKVQVKVPTTAGAYFGDAGWALCVKYNSLNFTRIYPQPYTSSVSIPSVKGTATLDTVACYEMPGMLVSAGADWEGTLYLDPTSGNHLNTTTVGITLVDKTAMLFNGNLIVGYDTSLTDGQNTDAGRANVATATALTIVPEGI